MTDISVQFHASPQELYTLVREVLHDYPVELVAMKFNGFQVSPTTIEALRVRFDDAAYERYYFMLGSPDLAVANELEFMESNSDCLRLDVGKLTKNGLEQSWLVARTDNHEALTIWRSLTSRLKRRSKAGVTAVNAVSGAVSSIKSYRYTPGAKALEREGMPMLAPAGASLLRFDETNGVGKE